jgi:hypothetical protein
MRTVLESYSKLIKRKYPSASVSTRRFTNGHTLLNVVLNQRLFALEYQPGHGFGLGEVLAGQELVPGYRFRCAAPHKARRAFAHLLASSGRKR